MLFINLTNTTRIIFSCFISAASIRKNSVVMLRKRHFTVWLHFVWLSRHKMSGYHWTFVQDTWFNDRMDTCRPVTQHKWALMRLRKLCYCIEKTISSSTNRFSFPRFVCFALITVMKLHRRIDYCCSCFSGRLTISLIEAEVCRNEKSICFPFVFASILSVTMAINWSIAETSRVNYTLYLMHNDD